MTTQTHSDGGAWMHGVLVNDLTGLRIYVAVVEAGSFSEAGRRMRIVPSTVSKHISALEARIGGQLISRTTQRLSVTELGRRFYERCLNILHEIEGAETEITEYQASPQGLLRVSAAPVLTGRHLMPIFAKFLSLYPKVKLELNVTTVSEDLIANSIDAAIRISNDLDPSLTAVKLAANERVYCASPAYLEKHGRPAQAADLVNHNCIILHNVVQAGNWPMRHPDGRIEYISVSGNFVSNNGDMLRLALLSGVGIGHIARFMVHDHLEDGGLIELFPESRLVVSNIYVVFPKRRHLPLKTRAFIDHLQAEFRNGFPYAGEHTPPLER